MKIKNKKYLLIGIFAIGTSLAIKYSVSNSIGIKNPNIDLMQINQNETIQYNSTWEDSTKTFIVKDIRITKEIVDEILRVNSKTRDDITNVKIEMDRIAVAKDAFASCKNLVSIENSTKIAFLQEGAFYGCVKLKGTKDKNYLEFGANTLRSIGVLSFAHCKALTEVKFVDTSGNEANNTLLTEINEAAFDASTLSTINLLNLPNLRLINHNAFKNTKLTSINLPSKVTTIGINAFLFEIQNSVTTVDIPASVTSIGQNAFNKITNVTFNTPTITTEITKGFDKTKIESITLGNTITSIGDNAFAEFNHTSLTSITLPSSLVSIGNNSFDGMKITELSNFKDLLNLTSIGNNAFINCQITQLELPANLRTIGTSAFPEVTTLNNVNNDELIQYIKLAFPKLANIQIKGSNITNIVNSAFEDMTTLTSVTFENTPNLYMIGAHAFKGTKISTIDLPDSLEGIESRAFEGTNLTSINLKNVDFIDKYAFFDLAITTITLPSNIEFIGQNAFNKTTTINIQTKKITNQIIQGFDKTIVTTITLQSQVNVVEKNSFTDFLSATIKIETSSNNLDKDAFNKINTLVVNTPEQYNKFRLKDSASITTLKYKDTNTAGIKAYYYSNSNLTNITIKDSQDLSANFFNDLSNKIQEIKSKLINNEFFFGYYFKSTYDILINNNNLMQNLRQINMDNSGNLEVYALTTGINIDSSNLKLSYTGKEQIISPLYKFTNPSLNSKNNKIDVTLNNPLTVKEASEYKHTFTYKLTLIQDSTYSYNYSTQQTIIVEKANVQIDNLPQDSTITLKPGENLPNFNFNFEIESINIKYISSTGKEFKDMPQDPGTYIMRVTITPKDKSNINETVLDYTLIIEASMMMPIIYGVSGSILFLLLLLLIIFLFKRQKDKKEIDEIRIDYYEK